jgi:adenylate cyclase
MSAEKDQEYYGDGIAEAIINSLSQIDGLRVIARTSTFAFKGKEGDIRNIGAQLDVNTVLEGSVQKEGNQLRITAQLINVDDGSHLWSKRFDRELQSVFAIQDEISMAIVQELKGRILQEEKTALTKRHTKNLDAYDLYLLGRNYYSGWAWQYNAITHYEMAIEKDPDYALAYAGLADSYNFNGLWFMELPDEAYSKAQEAAEKALQIDDTLAEAHTALANVHMYYNRDFPAAESEYKQAIVLKPSYADAHYWYSVYLRIMERFDEALEEIGKARELDPMGHGSYGDAVDIYRRLGQYDRAEELFHKGRDINPIAEYLFRSWERLHIEQGKYDEFIKLMEERGPNRPIVRLWWGHIYALAGQKEKTKKFLGELLEDRNKPFIYEPEVKLYIPSTRVAIYYISLGEIDQAFEWLNRALDEHDPWIVYITDFPEFDPLRSDSRFTALLKKIGLE